MLEQFCAFTGTSLSAHIRDEAYTRSRYHGKYPETPFPVDAPPGNYTRLPATRPARICAAGRYYPIFRRSSYRQLHFKLVNIIGEAMQL